MCVHVRLSPIVVNLNTHPRVTSTISQERWCQENHLPGKEKCLRRTERTERSERRRNEAGRMGREERDTAHVQGREPRRSSV